MSKLLALVVGIALAGLVAWVPDAYSQDRDPGPDPVFTRTIQNCEGHGPNRLQVAELRIDCDAKAILEECKVGVVHPVHFAQVSCPIGCEGYCKPWGCYLHGCP